MYRYSTLTALTLAVLSWDVAELRADVDVRAPFVHVQVNGGGVFVRAPFVNIFVPRRAPVHVVQPVPPPPPADNVLPPPQEVPNQPVPNAPPANPEQVNAPPQKKLNARYPTVDEFIRNFEPREGKYEVTVVNPVNNQPATARFSLPAGNPRIFVRQQDIEFDYGAGKSVRITFTQQGAVVNQ